MSFLFANAHELAALQELPYIQRIVYLMGIRPYMDRQSCIVGIKRRISYQSLRETLYVGPIAGVKTGSPSPQQMKRAVKSLERAGLIAIQSTERHLIVKCIFAELDKSPQNKAEPKPNPKADKNPTQLRPIKTEATGVIHKIPYTANPQEADPPQKSEIYFVCIYSKFEQFWHIYPNRANKSGAWKQFKSLNPDDSLFDQLIASLSTQVENYNQRKTPGTWKEPADWLTESCWVNKKGGWII